MMSMRSISIRKSDLVAEDITPEEGDVIVLADDSKWTIKSWVFRTMNTVYEFNCHQGRI